MWKDQLRAEFKASQEALKRATQKEKPRKKRKPRIKRLKQKGVERVRYFRLYALQLEGGKYYVGLTAQKAHSRMHQHSIGKGAVWTKFYKPIAIIEVRELGIMGESRVAALESDMTLEYMADYGVDNVRGGRWCQIMLGGKTVNRIEVMLSKHKNY